MTSPACLMSSKNATLPDVHLHQRPNISTNKRLATGQAPLSRGQNFGLNAFVAPLGKKAMLKKPKDSVGRSDPGQQFSLNYEEFHPTDMTPAMSPLYAELEDIKPVTQSSVSPSVEFIWGSDLDSNSNDMFCVNPMEVEGRSNAESPSDVAEVATPLSNVAGDIAMPAIEVALEDSDLVIEIVPNEDMISENDQALCESDSDLALMDFEDGDIVDDFENPIPHDLDFDLCKFMTDDTYQIDDPLFQAIIDSVDIESAPLTIDASVVQIAAENFVQDEPNLPVLAGEADFEDGNPVVKIEVVEPEEAVFAVVGQSLKRGRGRPRVIRPIPLATAPPK